MQTAHGEALVNVHAHVILMPPSMLMVAHGEALPSQPALGEELQSGTSMSI